MHITFVYTHPLNYRAMCAIAVTRPRISSFPPSLPIPSSPESPSKLPPSYMTSPAPPSPSKLFHITSIIPPAAKCTPLKRSDSSAYVLTSNAAQPQGGGPSARLHRLRFLTLPLRSPVL